MVIQGTNIKMIRGDTESIRVAVEKDGGVKLDLVKGDVIYFTVKENYYSEDRKIQKVISEFENGEALITIHPEDTRQLKPGNYVYDIQLNRSNGQVKTIVPKSNFRIEADVTHE